MKISKKYFFGTTTILGLSVLYSYFYTFTKIMKKGTRSEAWVGIEGTERNLNYVSWFLAATSYMITYYDHYKSFDSLYEEKDKRNLLIIYSGILGFSTLWAPYTANFINKKKKYKEVKNKNLYKKQGVGFILTMVTLFSFLHLWFRIDPQPCSNLPDRYSFTKTISDLSLFSKIYFLFHVGVVDNILWLRKFWNKY